MATGTSNNDDGVTSSDQLSPHGHGQPEATPPATNTIQPPDSPAAQITAASGSPSAGAASSTDAGAPGGRPAGSKAKRAREGGQPPIDAPANAREGTDRPRDNRKPKVGKTRRKRSPLWAKVTVALGSVLLLASLGSIAFVEAGLHTLNNSVRQENLLGNAGPSASSSSAAPHLTGVSIDGPINILLVGVDTRPNWTSGSHSDTIIIVHIPASHDRAYLVSIPRDTGVFIPADRAAAYPGGNNKINAAFTFGSRDGQGYAGGFQLLVNTIKQDYGIKFNGGAIVDFNGFKDVVNKLGGVDMYVDETTVSIHHGYVNGDPSKHAAPYHINPNTGVPYCPHGGTFDSTPLKCAITGVTPVVYHKGYQHLSAYDALDYVRARDGLVGTDYARQRHQQQFIKAILSEAFNQGLSNPLKMLSFVQSIGKAFIFDGGGISLNDWVFTLKGITPSALTTIKTNDGQFVNYSGPYIPGSVQALNSDSQQLLDAVRSDTGPGQDHVADFLAIHPSWVATDGSG